MKSSVIVIKIFRTDHFDSTLTCRVTLTLKIMLSIEFIFLHIVMDANVHFRI